jgi:muconolactone delta-isomerase
MHDNVFQDLRRAAVAVASEFAASQNLELDGPSIRLVRFPGAWRGLWVFDAVNPGGDFKELAVMMEPASEQNAVRLMSPGIVRLVSLVPFQRRTEALLASRPKGQGQTVSDAAYENAKRDGLGSLVHGPWRGMTGMAAPSSAPVPHQAE